MMNYASLGAIAPLLLGLVGAFVLGMIAGVALVLHFVTYYDRRANGRPVLIRAARRS